MPATDDVPRYKLPWRFSLPFLASVAGRRPRSFARDATVVLTGLTPPLDVRGAAHVPARGPCLIVCNHYWRAGFASWWLTFSIQGAVAACRAPGADREIHWVMASAWTYPAGTWRDRAVTPLTRWAFRRVARVYDFVLMPPMPPRPWEVEARAAAVLRTLRLARRLANSGGLIGLAPQGGDVADPLELPPPGAGEFIARLAGVGLPVLPVAVTEHGGRLRVGFGPVLRLDVPARSAGRDEAVSRQVMAAIGWELPAEAE